MTIRKWYDVIEYTDGSRELAYSTKHKEEAEAFAEELLKESDSGIELRENEINKKGYKITNKTIIRETEAVTKHYDFLKALYDTTQTTKKGRR